MARMRMQYDQIHYRISSNTSKLDIQLLFDGRDQRKIMKNVKKSKIFKVRRNDLGASKTHLGCI